MSQQIYNSIKTLSSEPLPIYDHMLNGIFSNKQAVEGLSDEAVICS